MTGPTTILTVRALDLYDRPADAAMGLGNAAWPEADLAIYVPFSLPDDISATRMFWYNGVPSNPANVDVGIYAADGTRLVSSGPTAQSGAFAFQIADITDTALSKNTLYYMAMCVSTAADDTFGRFADGQTGSPGLPGLYGVLKQSSVPSTTLPATATFETWGSKADFLPHFGIAMGTSTNQPKLS